MPESLKRRLLPVHRWAGLTVGLVIVVLALTGAGMVFRPQIEPLVAGDMLSVPRCAGAASLDAMTASAIAAYPQGTIDFIRVDRGEPGAARTPTAWIRFLDKETIYFNPCTGAQTGRVNRYEGFFGTLEYIHRARFIENGNKVSGIFVLAFLPLIALGGLVLWSPRRLRDIRQALRLHSRLKGPARRLNQHRVIGALVAPIVMLSALTGLPQAFNWYKEGVYRVAGSEPPAAAPHSAVPAEGRRLGMDALLAQALRLDPNPAQVQLRYPVEPADAIEGFFIARGAPHPNARGMFHLDAYNGKVLGYTPYATASSGHRLYFTMLSWHHGEFFGLFTQVTLFVAALGIPVLAWTGIGNYLRRRKRSRNAYSRTKPAPDTSG